ncbi:MAG: ATP-binding protein [Hydrogenoanaerobacterium sp.]
MNYSKELFEYALSTLSSRRAAAKAQASLRKDELYAHLPQLADIENELAGTASALVYAIMGSGQSAVQAIADVKAKNIKLQAKRTELLLEAGVGASYLEPAFTCRLCNDEGYINGKMCGCMEKVLRDEKLRRLNSSSSLSLSSFANFRLDYYSLSPDENGVIPREKMKDIYDKCVSFAKSFTPQSDKNLLLLGATGLGKTHLSLAVAAEVIGQGYEVIYGSVQDLWRKTESEKFSREGSTYDALSSILDCDLLILDDLGAEFATAFTASTLYNVINTRINHHKSTIISTNLTLKELNLQYADRVVSRLIGNYDVLWFKGQDIRRIMLEKR